MRRFERAPWLLSLILHVVVIVLGITVVWHAPLRRRAPPAEEVFEWMVLPPVGGTKTTRPTAVTTSRVAGIVPPTPAASQPLNVPLRTPTELTPASHADGPLVPGPEVGDGLAWVSPRPALPADVAERLYGDTTRLDSVASHRLRAMMDSLNQMLSREQLARQRPTWSTEVRGIPFGIDSQFINIAGIKIPTMALALLGNMLPPGNYDAALRERALDDMRRDLMYAALRTESFRDFQRYVKELRARKQSERDADRRRKTPPDTTRIIP